MQCSSDEIPFESAHVGRTLPGRMAASRQLWLVVALVGGNGNGKSTTGNPWNLFHVSIPEKVEISSKAKGLIRLSLGQQG
jgi:hypothetical protein